MLSLEPTLNILKLLKLVFDAFAVPQTDSETIVIQSWAEGDGGAYGAIPVRGLRSRERSGYCAVPREQHRLPSACQRIYGNGLSRSFSVPVCACACSQIKQGLHDMVTPYAR